MKASLLDLIFGCWHENLTRPITVRGSKSPAAQLTGTYCVCLDCGKEFPYDLNTMRCLSDSEVERKHMEVVAA